MVTYLKYTAGSNKGNVAQGDEFNSPFALAQTNNKDANYTSSKVSKTGTLGSSTTAFSLDWSPVVPGTVKMVTTGYTCADINRDGNLYAITDESTTEVADGKGNVSVVITGTIDTTKGVSGLVGTVTYGTSADGRSRTSADLPNVGHNVDSTKTIKGSITLSTGITGQYTVSYVYNNIYIPQNDVPLLNAEMDAIPLVAKARRIAVYFSQMANFQAKTDYGFDLSDSLAKQAVAQLSYRNLLVA